MEKAYFAARDDAKRTLDEPVPLQIRNAPTKLMKDLGYGAAYEYSHDYKYHMTDMVCLPDALKDAVYYTPTNQGSEGKDGDLGAGKTTWTQFFAKELGVKEVVNSPTFTIMKSYTQGNGEPLYHIDAYRLEGIHQDLGFEDCFDEGICVVEWADFIKDQLPEDILSISIAEGMDENRTVTIEASGPNSQSVMEALDD